MLKVVTTRISLVVICLFSISLAFAQQRFPVMDKSPLDVSYYPINYPILKIQDRLKQANGAEEPLIARVVYSRPQKNGRSVFGELVEYGKVWRLGANEATEIEFFRDVKIGGKKVKKGRYTIYAIVNPDKWTMILNTENDTWGSFKYDAKKDVVRIDVPVQKNTENLEAFAMMFEKSNGSFNLATAWDDVVVRLPISL